MRVLVLHDAVSPDARPDELDTLVQAEAVERGLRRLGHDVLRLGITLDLSAADADLRRDRPDVVYNLVEGLGGTGRLLHLAPALLDHLRLRYTGCATEAMFLTTGKLLAKRWLRAAGLPTPEWLASGTAVCDEPGSGARTVERDEGAHPADQQRHGPAAESDPSRRSFAPGPYIIKSAWEHASVGLHDDAIAHYADADALRRELNRRAGALGGTAYAEQFIDGREFNLSVLDGPAGPVVLPPAEIHFIDYAPGKPRIVGYDAKWSHESHEYHHTPRVFDFPPSDAPLLARLCDLALRCWRLFDLRGYARVDFRVDALGRPSVLEINANPCIAPDAGFPAAAARAGIDYPAMLTRILHTAG